MSEQLVDLPLLEEIIIAASGKRIRTKAVEIDRDLLAADVARLIENVVRHFEIANVVRPKLEATLSRHDSYRAKVQRAATDLSALLKENAGGLQQSYMDRFWGGRRRLPPWALLVDAVAAIADLSRPIDRSLPPPPFRTQLMTSTDALTWDLAQVFADHFGNASVAPEGPFARFAERIAISVQNGLGAATTTDGRTFARRLTALRQVYPNAGRQSSPGDPM